jgi:acetyl esterase/lipase
MTKKRTVFQVFLAASLVCLFAVSTARADIEDNLKYNFKAKLKDKIAEKVLDSDYAKKSCREKSEALTWLTARKKRGGKDGPEPSIKDVSYGHHWRQRYDVFLPQKKVLKKAPVIVMVHGGGWCIGDKAMGAAMQNKVTRWSAKGFVLVSVNYRMLPDNAPVTRQAEDVAKAIAHIQENARDWGGDKDRVIVMRHSAGAHLVSLIGASPENWKKTEVAPWLMTISLDSGTLNTIDTMRKNKLLLFDEAFGTSPSYWRETSPYHQMSRKTLPWLGVCASNRDEPCPQAVEYAEKAQKYGVKAAVLSVNMGHGAINKTLGQKGDYTENVELFMAGIDPVVAQLLGR